MSAVHCFPEHVGQNTKEKKILFIFPNTGNRPVVPNAIAIFAGIAKTLRWSIDYFDTYSYKKTSDSMEDREISGEFRSVGGISCNEIKKDFNDMQKDLQNKINEYGPDIIAISTISFEYEFLQRFINKIEIPHSTLCIIGGIHAILRPDEVINNSLFDMVCIGEGEETFSEILTKFEREEELTNIENTYFRDKSSGIIYKNPIKKLISQDKLWDYQPDYTLFDQNYFLYPFDGQILKRLNFETARGCPYTCSYCGNSAVKEIYKGSGKFVRERPVSSIKETLKSNVDDHGIELIYFQDECFLAHSIGWLKEFSAWYGKEIRKPYIIQTRPETVTDEKISILKESAPFFQISMGVESGSERILKDVCNRNVRVSKIVAAFELCRKYEIRTCAFFMIGLPYETRENIFESINLCRALNSDVAIVSIFQPLPGQKLRDVCIDEGFIQGDEPLPTFTSKSVLTMPQITSDEISNLRRVFMLYAKLPEEYYEDIERCEEDFDNNQDLYKELVNIRWSLEDDKIEGIKLSACA